MILPGRLGFLSLSLSARRAWIEIRLSWRLSSVSNVALRKESVDRNPIDVLAVSALPESLSARRAWIEMYVRSYSQF